MKERLSVVRSHGYGRHKPTAYKRTQVQRDTVNRWVRDWKRKESVSAYAYVIDRRDSNGLGSVEFHYYVNGLPNTERIDIERLEP